MITAALRLPTLFYFGVDGAFGAFTTLVTFLVFMLSRKMWQISKEKKYQYFSWVFGGITLSFFARTVSELFDLKSLLPPSRGYAWTVTWVYAECRKLDNIVEYGYCFMPCRICFYRTFSTSSYFLALKI